jgi:hypothetical protein
MVTEIGALVVDTLAVSVATLVSEYVPFG